MAVTHDLYDRIRWTYKQRGEVLAKALLEIPLSRIEEFDEILDNTDGDDLQLLSYLMISGEVFGDWRRVAIRNRIQELRKEELAQRRGDAEGKRDGETGGRGDGEKKR